ncbi:hypothetical protein M758_UG203500 [Ceratodon purpureus]|nr:hypothetical protein M758_UG203500 [Ceratodon purpureus]
MAGRLSNKELRTSRVDFSARTWDSRSVLEKWGRPSSNDGGGRESSAGGVLSRWMTTTSVDSSTTSNTRSAGRETWLSARNIGYPAPTDFHVRLQHKSPCTSNRTGHCSEVEDTTM